MTGAVAAIGFALTTGAGRLIAGSCQVSSTSSTSLLRRRRRSAKPAPASAKNAKTRGTGDRQHVIIDHAVAGRRGRSGGNRLGQGRDHRRIDWRQRLGIDGSGSGRGGNRSRRASGRSRSARCRSSRGAGRTSRPRRSGCRRGRRGWGERIGCRFRCRCRRREWLDRQRLVGDDRCRIGCCRERFPVRAQGWKGGRWLRQSRPGPSGSKAACSSCVTKPNRNDLGSIVSDEPSLVER